MASNNNIDISPTGGYDVIVIGEHPPQLHCGICTLLINNAMQGCINHAFCKSCIEKHIECGIKKIFFNVYITILPIMSLKIPVQLNIVYPIKSLRLISLNKCRVNVNQLVNLNRIINLCIITYAASSLANSSTMQTESGHPLTLGEKLKHIAQTSETRPCPDEAKCILKDKNVNTYVQTTLINTPDVVSIGIIWDTDRPSSKYIVDVMASITENVRQRA